MNSGCTGGTEPKLKTCISVSAAIGKTADEEAKGDEQPAVFSFSGRHTDPETQQYGAGS